MLRFPPNYFFHLKTQKKNLYEPLRSLLSLPLTSIHQMLHRCNIFKRDSHETSRKTQRIRPYTLRQMCEINPQSR